ncbi:MAG: HAD family hydrolase [Dehalococcoidia bacterium]
MPPLASLFDVDNTLLDNDAVRVRLAALLADLLGPQRAERFWAVYEEVRETQGIIDVPQIVRIFAERSGQADLEGPVKAAFFDFPFADYVFPGAASALEHAQSLGPTALLSDGDQVFQVHKIRRSGLAGLVRDNMLIVANKVEEFARVPSLVPADHYAMVDDKPTILAALKQTQGALVTTVLVRQGKYANAAGPPPEPVPDIVLGGIGEFAGLLNDALLGI